MASTQAPSERSNPHTFEDHARRVSLRLRRCFADSFAALGADPTRPRALARHLGWDKNLAWKTSRIATGDEPLAAVPLLPGPAGQRTILELFEQAGTPKKSVEAMRKALAEFEAMIETHAGDRETFEMMLADVISAGQAERDEAYRKQAFQANSALWGVQTRVRLSFNIVKPSRGSDRLDLTTVSGQIDFRRFRSDAVGTIFTMGNMCDDGSELSARRALALDPRADPSGPPLLPDFCSPNLLPLQRSPGSALETRFRLAQGPIGNVGQMTWIMGREQEHLLPRYRDEHDDICEFNVPLDSPTETLLFDLFLHNSLVYAQGPSPHLYSMLPGETQHAPVGARTELPLATRILDLSTDPLDVTAGEIANYPQIADWTFNRLGQNPADFRGYRLRIRYPLIPTRIAYRFTLLARPPAL